MRRSGGEPIEEVVPADDGADQDAGVRDRAVFARHAVLGGVGDDHQHEDVGHADRADAAPDHDAEKREQEKVHGAAAHDELRRGDAQTEQLAPIHAHRRKAEPGASAVGRRGRVRARARSGNACNAGVVPTEKKSTR